MNENLDHKSHLSVIKTANQYLSAGNIGDAERLYRFVVSQNQFNAEAWLGLSKIAERVARKSDAVECMLRAVVADPGSKECRTKLKKIIKNYNRVDKSLIHQKISFLFMNAGDMGKALIEIQEAIQLAPGVKDNLLYFSKFLEDVRFTAKVEPNVIDTIISAYDYEFSDHQSMTLASLSALKWTDGFLLLFDALENIMQGEKWEELLKKRSVINALNSKLLYTCLKNSLVTDATFELLLTKVRKIILKSVATNSIEEVTKDYGFFLSGLALQCFHNEYVFYVSDAEELWLEQLSTRILKELKRPEVDGCLLALYGSYKSLWEIIKEDILEKTDENAANLIKIQINEPELEVKLRKNIPVITEIVNDKSIAVREQYEANPFPRWRSFPVDNKKEIFSEFISRVSNNRCEPLNASNNIKILIAGCGTGLIPCIFAKRFPDAEILAIDITKASLAYGYRKAQEMGLKNIKFAQADILNLAKETNLNNAFDFINCFGVLHHMENIEPGWNVLNSLLKPNGVMQIGLYSKLARKSVYEIRDHILQKKYQSTSEGMRQCRHDLIKRNDQYFERIIKSRAFYSMSNFRDLAFHVHEICIDLIQLKEMLKEIKLEFLGFKFEYPETEKQYKNMYPNDPDMLSLDNWNEYEQKYPDTFENTYKFWVKKAL